MKDYYHCVPGRLRVKSQTLKCQPGGGSEAKRLLQGLDGVAEVRFTALTGSLVVLFDPDRIGPEQICGCLSDLGLFTPAPASSIDPVQTMVTGAGLRIGKAAAGWALGKVLQANGLSLLAALI
jgi:hypothetical protein